MKCLTPSCRFRANTNEAFFQGFCCKACRDGRGHGKKCQRQEFQDPYVIEPAVAQVTLPVGVADYRDRVALWWSNGRLQWQQLQYRDRALHMAAAIEVKAPSETEVYTTFDPYEEHSSPVDEVQAESQAEVKAEAPMAAAISSGGKSAGNSSKQKPLKMVKAASQAEIKAESAPMAAAVEAEAPMAEAPNQEWRDLNDGMDPPLKGGKELWRSYTAWEHRRLKNAHRKEFQSHLKQNIEWESPWRMQQLWGDMA